MPMISETTVRWDCDWCGTTGTADDSSLPAIAPAGWFVLSGTEQPNGGTYCSPACVIGAMKELDPKAKPPKKATAG